MNYIQYLTGLEVEGKDGPSLHKPGWWAKLATMKFAIWILILLGALSLLSLFVGELADPQMLEQQPKDALGAAGRLVYVLFEMSDPFRSWWYRGMLGVLCLSLLACILERTPIIWKLWTRRPSPDTSWLGDVKSAIVRWSTATREKLQPLLNSRFTWRLKTDDVWVGEHGRFGMWGPLLTHFGLLLLGVGALATSFGSTSHRAGGFAGETVRVEGMPFEVRVDSFRVIYYPLQVGQIVLAEGEWVGKIIGRNADSSWMVERWLSADERQRVSLLDFDLTNRWDNDRDRGNIRKYTSYVTVIEDGREVETREVSVNSPLRHSGYRFYQSSYDPDHPRVIANADTVVIAVEDSSGNLIRQLVLKSGTSIQVPGDTVSLSAGKVLPDFKMDNQFKAYSASERFQNPAVELTLRGEHGFEKTAWSFLNFGGHGRLGGNYQYRVTELRGTHASVEFATIFEIKRTLGTEILWLGFIISSIGLLLCFYVTHRVIYVEWEGPRRESTRLIGLTRKMSQLYANDLDRLLGRTTQSAVFTVPMDREADSSTP